jgi:hypothetical protein
MSAMKPLDMDGVAWRQKQITHRSNRIRRDISEPPTCLESPDSPGCFIPPVHGTRSGVGVVEGWRGTIVHRVEVGDDRIPRAKIVDPSWFNWPAVPVAMADTIVPDFPADQQELQSVLRPRGVVNAGLLGAFGRRASAADGAFKSVAGRDRFGPRRIDPAAG